MCGSRTWTLWVEGGHDGKNTPVVWGQTLDTSGLQEVLGSIVWHRVDAVRGSRVLDRAPRRKKRPTGSL